MGRVINYWDEPASIAVINIEMKAGKGDYDLPDKSILNNCSAWIGISCRAPGGSKKTRTGADLINSNAFNCAHIRLRSKVNEDYLREIPLEFIQRRDASEPFFRLPDMPFDIANSKISISDPSTITTGEEIELIILYR
ncbi:MAG: hypothetical protein MI974_31945 [Chitinophagales bacterium]|nr:hypothetical protein [Chitinophagales bacterium]